MLATPDRITQRLSFCFSPTTGSDHIREGRRSKRKNLNLPVLQELYHGDPEHLLSCVITGEVGFSFWPDLLTKEPKQRFEIDFNHIRQRASNSKHSGISVDKWSVDPSSLFRSVILKNDRPQDLIEFMCMMPVSKRAHRWISQDSAMGDITLRHFDHKYWPWHLQSRQNFDHIVKKYHLRLDYDWFIDHLSNINYPKINDRVKYR